MSEEEQDPEEDHDSSDRFYHVSTPLMRYPSPLVRETSQMPETIEVGAGLPKSPFRVGTRVFVQTTEGEIIKGAVEQAHLPDGAKGQQYTIKVFWNGKLRLWCLPAKNVFREVREVPMRDIEGAR